MKKVVLLLNTLRIGGAEVQTVCLANALAQRGYSVSIVSMDSNRDVINRISEKVDVHIMDKKCYLDFQAIKRLAKTVKQLQPSVVFTVNSYATMMGYLAKVKEKMHFPIISIQHTTDFSGIEDAVKNLYYRYFINHCNQIIFVSHNQRDHWIKTQHIKEGKSRVIHNGIDMNRFESYQPDFFLRQELGFASNDIVLGISASFRAEKKHEDMVMAGRMLRDLNYPVKLLLIGDGERRKEIEKVIEEYDMREHTVITGFVDDIRPFVALADIVLLTSTAVETLSIAALEAMAMGKPLILSNIGGASEIVNNGFNGFLYTAGDTAQLVQCVKEMVDRNLITEMGRQSSIRCRQLFQEEKMVEHYTALI